MKKYIITLIVAGLSLQSCLVTKNYERPELHQENQYRTDELSTDSLSIADISWKDYFQDEKLINIIDTALQQNIDIRIALEQLSAAESYYREGKNAQIPSISAAARVNHQELSKNSQFGAFFDGSITQYELTAALSWEADIWGKINSRQKAMKAQYLGAVEAHKAVKTRLIVNVATVYYQLLAIDKQLEIAEKTLSNRERGIETTKALKQAGMSNELAVQRAITQKIATEEIVLNLKNNSLLLENTLSILLAKSPQEIDRNSFDNIEVSEDKIEKGYPMQLLSNRADVRAAEFNLINAFELKQQARASLYPSLILDINGGLQSLEFNNLFNASSIFANFIGSLTQPILNRKQLKTQVELAESTREIAFLNFKYAVMNASKEVSDSYSNLSLAKEKLKLKKEELVAYDKAAEVAVEMQKNGIGTYLDVLTAEQGKLNAELELVNLKSQALVDNAQLYRALGGGWK